MDLFGATPKYAATTTDPIDGVPISWRAGGAPIRRGDAPDIVDQQAADRATVTYYARSQVFKIPEQLSEYNAALDWVINHTGAMPREMFQELGDGKWVVWMTWADIRGYIPKATMLSG